MNIPLTLSEIVQFLSVSESDVLDLWSAGFMKRTIACPYRSSGVVRHSSPFDVIEYALVSGQLIKGLSALEVVLWMDCLAEEVDHDLLLEIDALKQTDRLLLSAQMEGLGDYRPDCEAVAAVIIRKYREILWIVRLSDASSLEVSRGRGWVL